MGKIKMKRQKGGITINEYGEDKWRNSVRLMDKNYRNSVKLMDKN